MVAQYGKYGGETLVYFILFGGKKQTGENTSGWVAFNKSVESLYKIKIKGTCDSLSVQLPGGGVSAVSVYISVDVEMHLHPHDDQGKQVEAGPR